MIDPAPRPARIIHGDLAQIAGRPWSHALFWLVLLAAAGVDVVTFYQVLILVLDVPDLLVTIAVIGFAAVALTLAHYAGLQARQVINPRNITGSKTLALTLGGTWLLLGATAFIVRFVLEPAGSAGASQFSTDGGPTTDLGTNTEATSQHLAALLFLVLYVATGMVTALAGYFRQEPAARQFGRAVERRSTAAAKYADTSWGHAQAEQVWEAIGRARARRVDAMNQVDLQFEATADRLRAEAQLIFSRNRMAGPFPPPPAFPDRRHPADLGPPPPRATNGVAADDPTVPILLPPAAPQPRHPRSDDSEETP